MSIESSAAVRLSAPAGDLSGDLRQAARAAREIGLEGIALDVGSDDLRPAALSLSARREILRVVAAGGVEISALRADLPRGGFAPRADVERALDGLRHAIDVARALQAPRVCVDAGPLPPARAAPPPARPASTSSLLLLPSDDDVARFAGDAEAPPRDAPDEAFEAHLDNVLAEAGQIADRAGVVIAWRSSLASLRSLAQALARAACPWFGVDYDPTDALRDGLSTDRAMDLVGEQVRHLRGVDAIRGEGGRTRPAMIGRGDVAWREILDALGDLRQRPWLLIDARELPDRPAAIRAGAAQLRAFLES